MTTTLYIKLILTERKIIVESNGSGTPSMAPPEPKYDIIEHGPQENVDLAKLVAKLKNDFELYIYSSSSDDPKFLSREAQTAKMFAKI